MPFSKSFPRTEKDKTYPQWEEVFLTQAEEDEVSEKARAKNMSIMAECLRNARKLMQDEGMKESQNDLVKIGIALFEKRSSHEVYWKENKAKEKFDQS